MVVWQSLRTWNESCLLLRVVTLEEGTWCDPEREIEWYSSTSSLRLKVVSLIGGCAFMGVVFFACWFVTGGSGWSIRLFGVLQGTVSDWCVGGVAFR